MNFSMQNLNSKDDANRFGVTLVELLVVVSILSVLTAIMIPRLRVINKDRNIREAARVVGSALAKVNARAVNDGMAGLMIECNNNFLDAGGASFAGTRMYTLRSVPPFIGDDANAFATIGAVGVNGLGEPVMGISIPLPLEHTATNPLIQAGDQVRLNHSSVLYSVDAIPPGAAPGTLGISLSLGLSGFGQVRPALTVGSMVPFVVYRQPRKLESSRVDLPDGYMIDFRYSGPTGAMNQAVAASSPDADVRIFFNSDGSIDRYTYIDATGTLVPVTMQDSMYLYVAAMEDDPLTQTIFDNSNMWVTADRATGVANVGYNVAPDPSLPLLGQLFYARGLSKSRQSANQ
jgi:prepilin-type N-terminal cleavage/methylation domain-containing protein